MFGSITIVSTLKLACEVPGKAKITIERLSQQVSKGAHEVAVSYAHCAS